MQQQHAQAFTYNVLVEIVPHAKLNQSQLFELVVFTELNDSLQNRSNSMN